jgi:tetratricopeptide (TPR) repeat protein
LALHWAHRVAERFPDGQLYVNLRGFDQSGQVMEPAAAVRGFLDALGVPADRIPADPDARAALYRSLLSGRRMLVVLDNARDAEHARSLLPGKASAVAVVTSRNQLTDLVAADGAHPLTLDLLSAAEARELLERRAGPGRAAAEPDAVEQIITACAGLPLALALVAARAATHPTFPLAAIGDELAQAGSRLNAGDMVSQVRAVFSWSYTMLTPAAARLFRLLGLHPGPDISAPAAASLAALPTPAARSLLGELTRAGLLAEQAPGRYGFHDLLAGYAADLARSLDSDDQRRAATARLLDHYSGTAHTADRLLAPARGPIPLPLTPPAAGASPEHLADQRAALRWLDAERPVLLAALRLAARAGFDTHAWTLAWTLATFLDRRGHWQDMVGAWQGAVAAADRLTDHPAAAYAHRRLARAATLLGSYDQAHAHLRDALQMYTEAGDRVGQAHTHLALAYMWERQDRPRLALNHARLALGLSRAAGERRGQADALNWVGWCHIVLGDQAAALTYCQQALTLFQRSGDRWGAAGALDNLGCAHHQLTQHSQAADRYQHALTLFRDLADRYNEAVTLAHLGDAEHAAGDAEAARTTWQHALRILTELDHRDAGRVRARLCRLGHSTGP